MANRGHVTPGFAPALASHPLKAQPRIIRSSAGEGEFPLVGAVRLDAAHHRALLFTLQHEGFASRHELPVELNGRLAALARLPRELRILADRELNRGIAGLRLPLSDEVSLRRGFCG